MALIPAGSFTMGDTLDGESDAVPTNITVSAFYMGTNLVSYGQWQSVYNWATSHGYGFLNAGDRGPGYVNGVPGDVKSQPVESVDWYDAAKWCNARSQQAGALPVYYTDAGLTQVYTNGEVPVYMNWTAKGYRLPTEAEWEKAARGGLSGQRFPKARPTISEKPTSLATILGQTALMPPSSSFTKEIQGILTRVRWAILRRTVMDYTTWRAMNMCGVGTGMRRRRIRPAALIWGAAIQPARHRGASECCAAVIGAAAPPLRIALPGGHTTRTMLTRRKTASTSVFAVCVGFSCFSSTL